jgi:hypothetical protein
LYGIERVSQNLCHQPRDESAFRDQNRDLVPKVAIDPTLGEFAFALGHAFLGFVFCAQTSGRGRRVVTDRLYRRHVDLSPNAEMNIQDEHPQQANVAPEIATDYWIIGDDADTLRVRL